MLESAATDIFLLSLYRTSYGRSVAEKYCRMVAARAKRSSAYVHDATRSLPSSDCLGRFALFVPSTADQISRGISFKKYPPYLGAKS